MTRFRTLAGDGQLAFVGVLLETGRTHQIRVHMKHRGAPIVGDSLYGSKAANEKWRAPRQMLHARRVRFPHPVQKGEWVDVQAPLPDDFLRLARPLLKRLSMPSPVVENPALLCSFPIVEETECARSSKESKGPK